MTRFPCSFSFCIERSDSEQSEVTPPSSFSLARSLGSALLPSELAGNYDHARTSSAMQRWPSLCSVHGVAKSRMMDFSFSDPKEDTPRSFFFNGRHLMAVPLREPASNYGQKNAYFDVDGWSPIDVMQLKLPNPSHRHCMQVYQ